jgi:hypothetical protein
LALQDFSDQINSYLRVQSQELKSDQDKKLTYLYQSIKEIKTCSRCELAKATIEKLQRENYDLQCVVQDMLLNQEGKIDQKQGLKGLSKTMRVGEKLDY